MLLLTGDRGVIDVQAASNAHLFVRGVSERLKYISKFVSAVIVLLRFYCVLFPKIGLT